MAAHRVLRWAAAGTAVLVAATGCTGAGHRPDRVRPTLSGPAEPVPGAKRGGTLTILQQADFVHLDPQRQYVTHANAVDQLMVRTLTMLKNDPRTGRQVLVGDLATDAGTDVHHDGKTWRYTLRDGLRYADGSAVTAADVAYGVARSFSPNLADGPNYLQQWLTGTADYNEAYRGPYGGGAKTPPGVTVSGRTITFHLAAPHPDFGYAASLGTTAPIPARTDPGVAHADRYDTAPPATGPYRVSRYQRGVQLTLVRNRYWDPRTDPVRHDYPDRIVVRIGADPRQQTDRLIADRGADRYAVSIDGVPPERVDAVLADRSLRSREVVGFWPFVTYLMINTRRVTGVAERRAINYAIDKAAYLDAIGGPSHGEVASTLLSPTVLGFDRYDAYPTPGHGGAPARARQLLGGRHPTLRYAYPDTAKDRAATKPLVASLRRAGFRVVATALDAATFYSAVAQPDNRYDLYPVSWGADWPTGTTVLPPLFDGTGIRSNGNDWSLLSVPALTDRLRAVSAEPTAQAAGDWAALDRDIMRRYAPCVPLVYMKNLSLAGSRVHGVFQSGTAGSPLFYDSWLG
jgi:peptide/nickel transport system substrate-binding protein